MNECPHCGVKIAEGIHFCPGCGMKVGTSPMSKCSHCGAAITQGNRFCPECGMKAAVTSQADSVSKAVEIEVTRHNEWIVLGLALAGAVVGLILLIVGVVIGSQDVIRTERHGDFWSGYYDLVIHDYPHATEGKALMAAGAVIAVISAVVGIYFYSKSHSKRKRLERS